MRGMGIALVAALALGLAGCGGGGGGSPSASTDPAPDPTPPEPATGMVADVIQTTGLAKLVAAMAGEGSYTDTVEAGSAAAGGGVTFSCPAGGPDCDLTLSLNADGDVVVAWSGAEPTLAFIDPLENMNEANEAKIAAFMMQPIGSDADSTATPPRANNGADDAAVLGGLKTPGMIGTASNVANAGAADDSAVTLTGGVPDPNNVGQFLGRNFDPNVATSTLRAMADDTNPSNDIGDEQAGALGLMGWDHKVLHADWGDTAGGLDAGIETVALIYSNVEAPGAVAFSALGGDRGVLADATLRTWFALSVNFGTGVVMDNDDATDDPNNAVVIAANAPETQTMNALVSPTGQAFDGRVAHPDQNDEIRGEYFGASGTFKCTTAAGVNGCQISRDAGGATPFALSAGAWLFMPDEGAAVTIPDQDWVAFGVWLTAPDNKADGVHDIGVFYDGMETYNVANSPNGSATYAGKAAGYYVNGAAHGLFTADASLTAAFSDTANSLSGTIQNFRDSQGRYIDSDNPNTPNDPNRGGENDWGITLASTDLNDAGTFADAGMTSGTADGVTWNGNWMAQLYGPGGRNVGTEDNPATAPTGVAGNFSAITGELSDDGGYKGVVGAFGAEQSGWTPPATP